jgi:dTDP-glucose pyrophosphorylase
MHKEKNLGTRNTYAVQKNADGCVLSKSTLHKLAFTTSPLLLTLFDNISNRIEGQTNDKNIVGAKLRFWKKLIRLSN